MFQRLLLVGVVVALIWAETASCADTQPVQLPTLKLSQLVSAKTVLGDEWNGPNGFYVDDVNDLSHLDAKMKEIAEPSLKQAVPLGVVAAAAWSFRKQRIDQAVDIRILRFKDTAAAENWWKLRVEATNASNNREPIPELGEKAVRSVTKTFGSPATTERVLAGDTAIVVETMEPAETCRKVLVHYLNQLRPKANP
jgi:hypothetical protein